MPYLTDGGKQIILFSDLKIEIEKLNKLFQAAGLNIKNSAIAIWADKTIHSVFLLPALVYSNKGYIPVNSEWPIDRVKFILQSINTQFLIVDDARFELVKEILNDFLGSYSANSTNRGFHIFKLNVDKKISLPKELAYVLFTSGSTGSPKGIVHTNQSAFAFLNWCLKEFKQYNIKRHVSIAPLNFDLSVFDVFYPLLNQFSLFVPEVATVSNTRLFAQYLNQNKIESLYTTPSYLNLLEQTGKLSTYDFKHVKLVLIAGEALSYDLVRRLKTHFKNAVFYNLYGPTETNVCCAQKIDLKRQVSEFVPIGKSIIKGNLTYTKQGELCYKGKLLMAGYVNDSGYHSIRKNAIYKTGDYVSIQKGVLSFVGRKDNLIKRNGFRIELSEINTALRKHSEITNCETLFLKKENLVVSFVESGNDLSQLALKTFCIKHLPSYMVPDLIIVLRKIPVNLNHKADFIALKEIYAQTFKS